jgi:hypothetical protein
VDVEEILAAEEGPSRTAALVEWLQCLFADTETVPVLVGGAAVELYTLGAYTTGDIDLVGAVPAEVADALASAGFERQGRHWILEPAQVFIEFPGSSLGPDEDAGWLEVEGSRVRIISIEDLLVDRLGAWEYWRSSVDGANAFLLWQAQRQRIDVQRLERRVNQAGWPRAWRSLVQFAGRWENSQPPLEEVEAWANQGP